MRNRSCPDSRLLFNLMWKGWPNAQKSLSSSMQLMTLQAFLLQKNYRSETSQIHQSNGTCTEQGCPMDRTSLSTWRRNQMAVETCSPDLSHTRVLADVCTTALHCLGKGSEPHPDCSGFRELLSFSGLSTWQGSASVGWMSRCQPAVFGQNQALWFR